MFVLTSVPLFQCKPLQKPWGERRDAMQNIQDGGAKGCQRGCQEVWLVILKIASRNRMVAVKSSYDCSRKFVWLQSKVRMIAFENQRRFRGWVGRHLFQTTTETAETTGRRWGDVTEWHSQRWQRIWWRTAKVSGLGHKKIPHLLRMRDFQRFKMGLNQRPPD